MSKLLSIAIFLFTFHFCNAQNLVLNGDFEQYISCPPGLDYLKKAKFWSNPTYATPDYFNTCAFGTDVSIPSNSQGFQNPHSGNGYCGMDLFTQPPFLAEYREYAQVQLASALIANHSYHFEMYLSSANISKYSVANMGAYFSSTIYSWMPNTSLPFIPQVVNTNGIISDTLNWTLVSGDFTAAGGELYMIIGNFNNDANTVFQLSNPSGTNRFAYYYFDDISLSTTDGLNEANNNGSTQIYPNPFLDQIHVTTRESEPSEIIIYDISSRKLLQQKFVSSVSINGLELATGIYFYEVHNKNGIYSKGKLIKE